MSVTVQRDKVVVSRTPTAVAVDVQRQVVQVLAQLDPQGPAGPPGRDGTAASLVVGETPSGTMNGSNATFTAAFDFVPESVAVFVNGLNQRRVTDFNTSGVRTISLADSPLAGDVVRINYTRA